MVGNERPWIAQAFILVLYVITLVIYNRAKKEYVGGKIGAAINLIMVLWHFFFSLIMWIILSVLCCRWVMKPNLV